jgi:MFS transporter, DHA1 family, multidrug resistance protein
MKQEPPSSRGEGAPRERPPAVTEGWQRSLAALWVGQVLTMIGFSFFFPFIPLFIQTMGVEDRVEATQWAGIIGAASAISMAIAQPFWGRLADSWGRKPMVVRSMVGSGVLTVLMGFASTPMELLVLRFLQGAVTGTIAASTALVSTSVPGSRIGFALGAMQGAVFVGMSVGPLIGGVMADTAGFRPAFQIAGALMLVGSIIVVTLVRENFMRPAAGTVRAGIWTESRSLMALGLFPLLLAVIFLAQFGNFTITPVLSLFVAELSGDAGAATAAGLVLAATGTVSAVSALVLGRVSDRVGARVILPLCILGIGLLSLPQAAVQQLWQLIALRATMGVFIGGLMPSANALVAAAVPHGQRGAAFGLTSSAVAASHAGGPLFGAAVASFWGLRAVFIATGLVYGMAYVWAMIGLRRERRQNEKSRG